MKEKVKEYYIGDHGELIEVEDNKEESVNTQSNESVNEEVNTTESIDNHPVFVAHKAIIYQKDFDEDSKLLTNPFFYDYNPQVEDNIHPINTIEDYYIQRGKKLYNFGCLVRNDTMWLFRRRRILRNQMKEWRQEYVKRLSDLSVFGSSEFQTYEKKIAKGVNILFPIISLVTLAISFVLINGKLWVFFTPSQNWALIATYFCIFISFFTLMMSILINKSVASIKSLYSINKNEYKRQTAELDKEFEKKYLYTYNYYVKGLKHNFKKPVILLDKTAVGEARITQIETVISENSKRLQGKHKLDKFLALPKILLKVATIISFLYVVGYVLYEIAKHFINN